MEPLSIAALESGKHVSVEEVMIGIFCVAASYVADLPGYHGEIDDKGAM